MTDDAVGIEVAKIVFQGLSAGADVDFVEATVGGLELVELLEGHSKAVIIDAIQTSNGKIGDFYTLDLEKLKNSNSPSMTHQIGLIEGLELGKKLGMKMPQDLSVYAVEVEDVYTFGTELTKTVKDQVPIIAQKILSKEFSWTIAVEK